MNRFYPFRNRSSGLFWLLLGTIYFGQWLNAQEGALASRSVLPEGLRSPAGYLDWRQLEACIETADFPGLLAIVKPLAEAGQAEAAMVLGYLYRYGLGVDCDEETAARWLVKAADLGNTTAAAFLLHLLETNGEDYRRLPAWLRMRRLVARGLPRQNLGWLVFDPAYEAQNFKAAFDLNLDHSLVNGDAQACYNLSRYYAFGLGVERNLRTAQVELRKAAAKGHPAALYELGRTFDPQSPLVRQMQEANLPLLEEPDEAKALQLYEKAAEAGDLVALREVARYYDMGKRFPQNKSKAFRYYQMAAAQNDALALAQVGYFYDAGIAVETDKVKAFESYKKAAELGNVWAYWRLGMLYDRGIVSEPNPAAALTAYREGALRGNAICQRILGIAYRSGSYGLTPDFTESVFWLERAAAQGDGWALYQMGINHYLGLGVGRDWAKAISLFENAAEQGIDSAYSYLGTIYSNGNHQVKADLPRAFASFKRGADAGDPDAMVATGLCAAQGRGTVIDFATAIQWLEKAIAIKHPSAYPAMAYVLALRDGEKANAEVLRQRLREGAGLLSPLAEVALQFLELSPLPAFEAVKRFLEPNYRGFRLAWAKTKDNLKIAGNQSVPHFPPLPVYIVEPKIPPEVSYVGSTAVLMTVDAMGRVTEVKIEGEAPPSVQDACEEAARLFLFIPGRKEGQPSTFKVRQAFDFGILQDRPPKDIQESIP